MSGIDIRLIAAHQAKRIAATLALVAIACGVALSIIHIFLGQESEFEPKIVHPLDVAAGVMVMAIGLAFLGHIAKWTRLALLGALIGLGVGSLAMVLPGVWMVIVRHIVTISQIPISDAATLNPLSENSVIGLCIVAASLIYVLRRPQPSLHVPRLSGALLCGLGAAALLGLIAGREEVYRLGEYGAADSLVVTVDALAALCLGSVAMILPLIGAEVSPLPERLRARMLLWPGIVIVALLLARSVDRYQWQRIGASTHDHLKGTSRLIESRLHAVTMAMADLARHTNGSGHIHSTACPLARLRWLECSEILRSVSEQPIAANDDRVMNESGEVRAPFQLTVIDKEWVRFHASPRTEADTTSTQIRLDAAALAEALVGPHESSSFESQLTINGNARSNARKQARPMNLAGWRLQEIDSSGLAMTVKVRPNAAHLYLQRSGLPTVIVVAGFLLATLLQGLVKSVSIAQDQSNRLNVQNTKLAETIEQLEIEIDERVRTTSLLQAHNSVLKSLRPDITIESLMESIAHSVDDIETPFISAIFTIDEPDSCLRFVCAPGATDQLSQLLDNRFSQPDSGPIAAAATSGQTILTDDLGGDARWKASQGIAISAGCRACIAEPIRLPSGELVGVMALIEKSALSPSERQVRHLKTAAQLTGVVLDRYHTAVNLDHTINELRTLNKEIEDFVYTVSHDLKAPLVTVAGYTGILAKRLGEHHDETLDDWAGRINNGVTHMRRLVDDLLALGRSGRMTLDVKSVDLNDLVQLALEQLDPLIQQNGATIEVEEAMPVIRGDSVRLLQIVQNLIENALRHARPKSGVLRIQIGTDRSNQGTRIFVQDNGQGIDAAFHESIFGVFDRLDDSGEGSGLGLAIVKRAVEHHGGRVWLESTPGHGAIFNVLIPDELPRTNVIQQNRQGERS